jgi:hypothetical protein
VCYSHLTTRPFVGSTRDRYVDIGKPVSSLLRLSETAQADGRLQLYDVKVRKLSAGFSDLLVRHATVKTIHVASGVAR